MNQYFVIVRNDSRLFFYVDDDFIEFSEKLIDKNVYYDNYTNTLSADEEVLKVPEEELLFKKDYNEIIEQSISGIGGLLLKTNRSIFWVQCQILGVMGEAFDKKQIIVNISRIPLELGNLNIKVVDKIEMNEIPILYMLNQTVYAYGRRSKTFSCAKSEIKMKSGHYTGIRRVIPDKISKFLPYAENKGSVYYSLFLLND